MHAAPLTLRRPDAVVPVPHAFHTCLPPPQRRIERFRAAYNVRNKIEVLLPAGPGDELAGLPREVLVALQEHRRKVSNGQRHSSRSSSVCTACCASNCLKAASAHAQANPAL